MMVTETKSEEFSLSARESKDGKFYFTAVSLNNNFECDSGLERLARDSYNKPLVWRHRHPADPDHSENHIYGKILESVVKEGKMISKYEVYNHTQDHLDFIELIKERINIGDPLGISMRYRKYYDGPDRKHITHYDVFEHSGTPFPKCEKCKSIEYIGEESTMPDEPEQKEETKKPDVELEISINIDEAIKKIDELQKSLDSKTEAYEQLLSKVETLEKEMEAKGSTEESLESENKTLEKKVEELTLEVEYLKKKPTLDEMFEIKKGKLNEQEKAFYKSWKLEDLKGKLVEWQGEATSTVQVKSQEESAEESMERAGEESNQEQKKEVSMEQFTRHLSHNIRDRYKQK